MAWTSATLTQAIQDYLQNSETGFVANIPIMIQQAEDRISKAVILPMNRKTTALAFVAGTQTVALPPDFLAPFEFRAIITATNNYNLIDYYDVAYMRETYPNPATTGVPKFYSMFDSSTLIMAPTPDATCSGSLRYFYKPDSITVTTTSWLGTNAENCLLYGCLTEAYAYMKGEADLQKLYEDRFVAALAALKTLGEGMDMGDAARMSERRTSP